MTTLSDDALIREMRDQGKNWSEIGAVVGKSRDSVRRRYEKAATQDGRIETRLQEFKRAMVEAIAQHSSYHAKYPYRQSKVRTRFKEGHMYEVCLMDLHLAKLAWAEETGSSYDMKIACDVARAAVDDLLSQASQYHLDKIVFPLGNDFFHVDNIAGMTTAGTPQDRDSRYHKMFVQGEVLASEMVRCFAGVAPVEVVIVPGNHDETAAFHLGRVLAAEFRRDKRVTVDTRPPVRKYVHYGVNLIGYTHGSEEAPAKLPAIMATEVPELWAKARYREWHLGHEHKSKRVDAMPVDSHNGCRVRRIQSMTGTDLWHYKKGYIGEPRAAEGFVWSQTRGLRANFFSMVDAAA